MKNFSKILAFFILSMFFVSNVAADDWAEEDCLEYEQMIGGLVWLSGETLDMSDKARKAGKEEEAKGDSGGGDKDSSSGRAGEREGGRATLRRAPAHGQLRAPAADLADLGVELPGVGRVDDARGELAEGEPTAHRDEHSKTHFLWVNRRRGSSNQHTLASENPWNRVRQ